MIIADKVIDVGFIYRRREAAEEEAHSPLTFESSCFVRKFIRTLKQSLIWIDEKCLQRRKCQAELCSVRWWRIWNSVNRDWSNASMTESTWKWMRGCNSTCEKHCPTRSFSHFLLSVGAHDRVKVSLTRHVFSANDWYSCSFYDLWKINIMSFCVIWYITREWSSTIHILYYWWRSHVNSKQHTVEIVNAYEDDDDAVDDRVDHKALFHRCWRYFLLTCDMVFPMRKCG